MAKYTAEEKAALAAAGERLGIIGKKSKVLANINDRRARKAMPNIPKNQIKKHRETREEYLARMLATYQIKPLRKANVPADHDVTNPTRYQAVMMWNAGSIAKQNILHRYRFAMKEQGVTPMDFRLWREQYMLMSREELASIVRVTPGKLANWETGKSPIPFSMWWMMHCTMQDPAYFLTRPGFHDFYIEYENGEALLCSYTWPDIRCSATDIYFNRTAFGEVLSLRERLKQADAANQELQAENTRLREMYKTGAVTHELQAMHEHIGQLMKRLNTADVMPFQGAQRAISSTSPVQAAA